MISPTRDTDRIDVRGLEAAVPQIWAEAQARYLAMRKAQPKGSLPLNLVSAAAVAEAKRLQDSACEVSPAEIAAEVIAEWLDTPVPPAVALRGVSARFDAEPGEERLVRGAVTVTTIITELGQHPALRNMRPQERVFAQALGGLSGWVQPGDHAVRLEGVRARWYFRKDLPRGKWHRAPDLEADILA